MPQPRRPKRRHQKVMPTNYKSFMQQQVGLSDGVLRIGHSNRLLYDAGFTPSPRFLYKQYFQQPKAKQWYRPGKLTIRDIQLNQFSAMFTICRLPFHYMHTCKLPGIFTQHDVHFLTSVSLSSDVVVSYPGGRGGGGGGSSQSSASSSSSTNEPRYYLRPRRRLAAAAAAATTLNHHHQPDVWLPILCLKHTRRFDIASAPVPPCYRRITQADRMLANRISGDRGTLGRLCGVTNASIQAAAAAEAAVVQFTKKMSQQEYDAQQQQTKKDKKTEPEVIVISSDDSDDDVELIVISSDDDQV